MARAQRRNRNTETQVLGKLLRVEKPAIERNMTEQQRAAVKNTRRGIVSIDGDGEYYFSANTGSYLPVVFGATSIDTMLAVRKILDDKMKECGKDTTFFKTNLSKETLLSTPQLYFDEIEKGTFIIKNGNHYFGYMMGASGYRAVSYRKGGSPYSCSVSSLIKDLDRPGKQSFRKMSGQGERIREMISPLMMIIAEIDRRCRNNDGPDDGSTIVKRQQRRSSTRKENKGDASSSPSSNNTTSNANTQEKVLNQQTEEINIEMPMNETEDTNETVITTQRKRRNRRTKEQDQATNDKDNTQQKIEPIQTKESYCGCCNMTTIQKIISDSELQCMVCGETWERFDEPEDKIIENTEDKETQDTKDEVVQDTEDNKIENTKEETMENTEEKVIQDTEDKKPTIHPKMKRRKRRSTNDDKPKTTNDAQDTKDEVDAPPSQEGQGCGARTSSASDAGTGSNVSSARSRRGRRVVSSVEQCSSGDASVDDFDDFDFGFDD